MMKKSLLSLIVVILFSCSTNNSDLDDTKEEQSGTLLKTFRKFSAGVLVSQIDFEYDSNGNITRQTSTGTFGEKTVVNFVYDSNNEMVLFEENITDAFGDVTVEVNNLNYQNGNVVKICQEITPDDSFSESRIDKIEFAYDDSFGNVELFKHYDSMQAEFFDCDDIDSLDSTEMLEYDSSNNMIRYENSNYFFGPTYLTYTYDNKNHPYANMKPSAYRKLLGFSTVNNIASAKEYNADTDEVTGTVTYTYEFNSSDFPTKMTKVYTASGSSLTQTTVFEYDYY